MHTKPFGQLLSSIRPLELVGLVRCAAQSSAEVTTLRLTRDASTCTRALRLCLTASLRRQPRRASFPI
eukprot:5190269-Pleurochrysis_carterae.AAC.2